jgi:tetratricopeptide (TPR) repeat protein
MTVSDPNDTISRMYLGTALAQMGNPREAIQQFSEALRQTPQNTGLHYNLGIVLLRLGSEEEALEHFQAAVGSDPLFTQANFQMANLSMRHGRFTDAEQAYARVIEQEPSNGFARLMQVMALVRLKQYVEARRLLEEGLRALPNDPDLTHALARLLAACPLKSVRSGQRALELSQKLLKADKDIDFDRIQTLSMAMAEAGQFENAVQLLRSVILKLDELKRRDLSQLLEGNLRLFQQGKPCRTPWRDDDPIFSPVPGSPILIAPTQLSPMQTGSAER